MEGHSYSCQLAGLHLWLLVCLYPHLVILLLLIHIVQNTYNTHSTKLYFYKKFTAKTWINKVKSITQLRYVAYILIESFHVNKAKHINVFISSQATGVNPTKEVLSRNQILGCFDAIFTKQIMQLYTDTRSTLLYLRTNLRYLTKYNIDASKSALLTLPYFYPQKHPQWYPAMHIVKV